MGSNPAAPTKRRMLKGTRLFCCPQERIPANATDPTKATISTVSRYPPKPTKPTISTKSRFHGTPRKARNQRFQRNHDFTAPQRNHESNDFNGFTVPPETHETNGFNEITIPRPPNGITKATISTVSRYPTKSTKATVSTKATKCPKKRRFVGFVVYVSIVISLGTLPKLPSQSRRPAGVSPAPPKGEPSVPPSNPANEW